MKKLILILALAPGWLAAQTPQIADTIELKDTRTAVNSALSALDSAKLDKATLTTLGDLPYFDGAAWIRLAGSTAAARRLLCQTGSGSTSAAPVWCALVAGDIPDLSATYLPLHAKADTAGAADTATTAATATAATAAANLAGGSAGQYPYQSAPGVTGYHAPNAPNGPLELDANGNARIGSTLPAGAPSGSIGAVCSFSPKAKQNPMCYGAIADGSSHPLSSRFPSLGLAQLVYPHVTSLSQEIDWAAFMAAILASYNGSGVGVYAPAGHYILGPLTLPNDGVSPQPHQPTLVIEGAGAEMNGPELGEPYPSTGTILDFPAATAQANISSFGMGHLVLTRLSMVNSGSGTQPHVVVTNTVATIDDVAFWGSPSVMHETANQDAIVAGGATSTKTGDATGQFQGYQLRVERCHFARIRRALWARSDANGFYFGRNVVWNTSGAPDDTYAAVVVAGGDTPGQGVIFGGAIKDNIFESYGYPITVLVKQGVQLDIEDNTFYDASARSVAYVRFLAGSYSSTVSGGLRLISGGFPSQLVDDQDKRNVIETSTGKFGITMADGIAADISTAGDGWPAVHGRGTAGAGMGVQGESDATGAGVYGLSNGSGPAVRANAAGTGVPAQYEVAGTVKARVEADGSYAGYGANTPAINTVLAKMMGRALGRGLSSYGAVTIETSGTWYQGGIGFYTAHIDGGDPGQLPTKKMFLFPSGGLHLTTSTPVDPGANNLRVAGTVSSFDGTQTVYRCTTAGTLPLGSLTIVSGSCGAAIDTGLRVN